MSLASIHQSMLRVKFKTQTLTANGRLKRPHFIDQKLSSGEPQVLYHFTSLQRQAELEGATTQAAYNFAKKLRKVRC